MGFIKGNLSKNADNVGVLFIMTIDPEEVSISSSTPFALIDDESAIPSEQEILFSMHTIFRIENIQQMKDKERIYEVQLTLTDDNDPQLTGLTQRMREELTSSGCFPELNNVTWNCSRIPLMNRMDCIMSIGLN